MNVEGIGRRRCFECCVCDGYFEGYFWCFEKNVYWVVCFERVDFYRGVIRFGKFGCWVIVCDVFF